jgi:PilZ domain
MDDRRRDVRHAAAWPSRIWTDEGILVGRTVDVSDHGICFVSAPTSALKVGDCYRIEIVGGSGESIASVAEVRHISARGVGLEARHRVLPAGVVVAR